jgi:beta propeller repeat protein
MKRPAVVLLILGIVLLSSCSFFTGETPAPGSGIRDISGEIRQIGERFYYGQDSIRGKTLVVLEYEYKENRIAHRYISTIDLRSYKKKRVYTIPDSRIADTPSIYENKVVFASVDKDEYFNHMISSQLQPPPNYDVFLLNIKSNKLQQLTTEEHAQICPRIDGNTIVWLDARNQQTDQFPFSYDIYAYDITTGNETRITSSTTAEGYNQVDISDNIVVWTDMRHADMDIASHAGNDALYNNEVYACNLSTGQEQRITTSPKNDRYPVIDAGRIVWLRQADINKADIFLYDLESGVEMQISHSGYAVSYPAISGDRIA